MSRIKGYVDQHHRSVRSFKCTTILVRKVRYHDVARPPTLESPESPSPHTYLSGNHRLKEHQFWRIQRNHSHPLRVRRRAKRRIPYTVNTLASPSMHPHLSTLPSGCDREMRAHYQMRVCCPSTLVCSRHSAARVLSYAPVLHACG